MNTIIQIQNTVTQNVVYALSSSSERPDDEVSPVSAEGEDEGTRSSIDARDGSELVLCCELASEPDSSWFRPSFR